MNSRPSLHQLILQHKTAEAIDFIKERKNADQLVDVNEKGLTPLQLAAFEGQVQVVIELLKAGVPVNQAAIAETKEDSDADISTKTPLTLALEQGHFFVADVLSVFGADNNLGQKEIISSALFFLNLKNFVAHHKNPKIISEKDRSGLLELAAYLNNPVMVEELLAQGVKIRHHTQIRTAGYWAAVNDNDELFKKVCPTDEDAVYTLWQLKQDQHEQAFEKFYAKASTNVKDLYENSLDDVVIKNKETIHPNFELTYENICKKNIKSTKLIDTPAKFYAVTAYAYQESNFVAVFQCLQLWQQANATIQNKLTKHAFYYGLNLKENIFGVTHKNQKSFMSFWLLVNDIHPYQFLLNNIEQMHLDVEGRKAWISAIWSREGLLNFSISRLLSVAQPEDDAIYLFQEKRSLRVFRALLGNLQIRYNYSEISQLLKHPETRDLNAWVNSVPASEALKNLFCQCFKQLGLFVSFDKEYKKPELRDLPNTIWMKIINEMLVGRKVDLKQLQNAEKKNEDESMLDLQDVDLDEEEKLIVDVEKVVAQEEKQEGYNRYLSRWRTFDEADEKYSLTIVSKSFYLFSKMLNPSNRKQIENFKKTLDQDFQKYDRDVKALESSTQQIQVFLNNIQHEIESKSCLRGRPFLSCLLFFKILFGITFALNIVCYAKLKNQRGNLGDLLETTFPPNGNQTCNYLGRINNGTYHANAKICEFTEGLIDVCLELCDLYNLKNDQASTSTFTIVMCAAAFGVTGLFTLMAGVEACDSDKYKRFDTLPLTTFSKKLKKDAKTIFEQKAISADFFRNAIAEVRQDANEALYSKRRLLQVIIPVRNSKRDIRSVFPNYGRLFKSVAQSTHHLSLAENSDFWAERKETKGNAQAQEEIALEVLSAKKMSGKIANLELTQHLLELENGDDLELGVDESPSPRRSRCPTSCVIL